jgi:predicted tellurium resistance membrane protein TerC
MTKQGAQLAKRQSVTSLDLSPEQERKQRMVRYTIAMSIRTLCIILGVISTGVLMWVFFALAIFLPYFAVVLANAQGGKSSKQSDRLAPKITIKATDMKIDES